MFLGFWNLLAAGHCGFIYTDLHWVNLDVCVVYTLCHMPAEYIFHQYLDLDSCSRDDWYFSAYQGKTMLESTVWELCTSTEDLIWAYSLDLYVNSLEILTQHQGVVFNVFQIATNCDEVSQISSFEGTEDLWSIVDSKYLEGQDVSWISVHVNLK